MSFFEADDAPHLALGQAESAGHFVVVVATESGHDFPVAFSKIAAGDVVSLTAQGVNDVGANIAHQRVHQAVGHQNLFDAANAGHYQLDEKPARWPKRIFCGLGAWAASVGGAAFNVINMTLSQQSVPCRRLGAVGESLGKVAPSGLVHELCEVRENLETDWLCGGAVWRREVIENYCYDNWFQGTGFMEDVDYSYGVRERYRLFVVAAARLAHFTPPVRADRQWLFGKWQVVNRMYIVRKYRHRGLSPRKAWSASLMLLAANIIRGIVLREPSLRDRGLGNLAGIISELRGKSEQIGGFLK